MLYIEAVIKHENIDCVRNLLTDAVIGINWVASSPNYCTF